LATQNPQRVELGETLRLAREGANWKPADVEKELRWYGGKVTRVERGQRVPVSAEVDKMADLYKLTPDERERLHLLADSARRRESPARVADFAQSYVTMERAAVEVNYYDAELIWGPLQVGPYARAVLTNSRTLNVEESVEDRLARHALLTRDEPPRVRVVLGEAVLHRLVGGETVLMAQLAHLLDVGRLPNVDIRILPFSVGAHRALGVGFTQLRLEVPAITRVYIEGLTDATYIVEPGEIDIYVQDFNELWSMALDERDSATILRRRIGND
jgi:uncharacterized protein DUF5753/helix-turn-helix protein